MAEEQALLPFIQQAYGQGLKAPSIEPFKETFKRNADQKREEFKSASELGLELDAQGWGIWSKQIESLYEKAKTGEITVGSAEWFAEKQKASASAGAMKQAQDLIKEHEDGIIKMNDQFIYSETNEAGNTKVMGLDDFRKNIRDIYDRDFRDEMTPMEVVNEITNELGKFTSLPMGVNTALKEAQTRGLAISRELQRMGGDITAVSFKNGQVVVATTQDDQDPALAAKTAEEVQALADQYKPYLELKYETDTPTDQKTPDGKEGYVQDFIKSLLFTERSPDVTTRNPVRDVALKPRKDWGSIGMRLEDITRDVATAIENSDPTAIEKYTSSLSLKAKYLPSKNSFVFYQDAMSSSGKPYQKEISTIPAESQALTRFIISENEKFIDRESLDEFPEVSVDQDKAKSSRAEKAVTSFGNKLRKGGNSGEVKDAIKKLIDTTGVEGVKISSGITNIFNSKIEIDGVLYSDPDEIVSKIKEKLGSGNIDTDPLRIN
jgi:hypothetical protein